MASTPQRGLAAIYRPNVTRVHVAVCDINGAPLLLWLGQWGRETEHPPYRDPVLHFHAPRLVALRGGDRNEEEKKEKNATENEREMLMHRACARTLSPRSFLLLEHHLQPTPSPLCGLASWPLLDACSMFPRE